jgi:hypothetical protein
MLAGQELLEGERGASVSRSRSRMELDSSLGIIRPEGADLPADVFDRLHINSSSSFILKNTDKVEMDDMAPFYVGVAPPNVSRDM